MSALTFVHYPKVIRGDVIVAYRGALPVGDIGVMGEQDFDYRFSLVNVQRSGRVPSLEEAKYAMEVAWADVEELMSKDVKINLNPVDDVMRLVNIAASSGQLANFMQTPNVKRLLDLMDDQTREDVLDKSRRAMRRMLASEKSELVDGVK
jgi:hypothetical protein